MKQNKDLYAVLEIPKNASTGEIRKAYHKLARAYHPDRNPGDHAAEERFKEASQAHDVLADPDKRRLYDEFGEDGLQANFDPQRARAYRNWSDSGHGFSFGGPGGFDFGFDGAGRQRRRAGAGGGGGFADIFSEMFGAGQGDPQPAGPAPKDLEHPIEVGFLDALRGTTMNVSVRRSVPCAQCGGSGRAGRRACGMCSATGSVEKRERLAVKIPPGVGDGSRVRVSGKGAQGAGGQSGNLDFVVTLRPHPILRRDGRDLLMDVPITVREAVEGAAITVPTPAGKVQLRVKPDARSGQRLRLAGRGAPDPKGGTPGDLIVTLLVQVPAGTGDLGPALDALDAAYGGDVRGELVI